MDSQKSLWFKSALACDVNLGRQFLRMGSREDFMALLKAIKAREDARVDGLLAGLKVDRIAGWVGGLTEPGEKLPSAEAFARGHPKVATEILADGVA